jgi:thioredoxin 1
MAATAAIGHNGQGEAAPRPGEAQMATKKTTDASFDQDVLKAAGPVVVDYWAEWCGPCRQIAPALEEIAGEMGDKVTVVKLNIDENPEAATKYGVRGIPTLMLFKDGQVASTQVGAHPKGKIVEWIERSI